MKNPQQSIQANLVSREGELGKELDKMRMLLARVAGRVEGLRGIEGETGNDEGIVEFENAEDKLDEIIGIT